MLLYGMWIFCASENGVMSVVMTACLKCGFIGNSGVIFNTWLH